MIRHTEVHHGSIAVIFLSGHIDRTATMDITASLMEQIEAAHGCVVIDVHDVSFFDSTGFALLESAAKQCRVLGGALVLARMRAALVSVLKMLHLHQVLVVYATVDDAVRAVGQAREQQ